MSIIIVRKAATNALRRRTIVAVGGDAEVSPTGSMLLTGSHTSWIHHKDRMEAKLAKTKPGMSQTEDSIPEEEMEAYETLFQKEARKRKLVSSSSVGFRDLLDNAAPPPPARVEESVAESETATESQRAIEFEAPAEDEHPHHDVKFTDDSSGTSQPAFAVESVYELTLPVIMEEDDMDDGDEREERVVDLQWDLERRSTINRDSDDDLEKFQFRLSERQSRASERMSGRMSSISRSRRDTAVSITSLALDVFLDNALEAEESEAVIVQSKSFVRDTTLTPDFFADLGVIPDLNDISLTSSDSDTRTIRTTKSDQTLGKDVGIFVDPLTGEVLRPSEPELPKEQKKKSKNVNFGRPSSMSMKSMRSERSRPSAPEEEEFGEEFEEEEYSEPEDDELLALIELDDLLDQHDEEERLEPDQENIVEELMDIELENKVVDIVAENFESIVRRSRALQIMQHTDEFLATLIDMVVDTCEMPDPVKEMTQNLDKFKLIREIIRVLNELELEQKTRFFLNRKVVDYYRRKKIFRHLSEETEDATILHSARYEENMKTLDRLLGEETELQQVTEAKIEQLKAILGFEKSKTKVLIDKFEKLVEETLVRENSKFQDKMIVMVQHFLDRLKAARSEISEVRFQLIEKQHTHLAMAEKLEELQNIGDGLHMGDYERLQTETLALGKKIEERNIELAKARGRCTVAYHMIAHMKERQQMIRGNINTQRSKLVELERAKHKCRKRLYKAKVQRGKIRREIQELSFKGGLLDKPALMLDYDSTVHLISEHQHKLQRMHLYHKRLQERFMKVEEYIRTGNWAHIYDQGESYD